MRSEWREVRASKVIDIIGGGTPSTRVLEYWDGPIPWISVKDFPDNTKYIYKTERTITKKGLEESSTKLLNTDDVIISARGTVGKIAMLSSPMAFNQTNYGLRGKSSLIQQHFLYYALKNSVDNIHRYTHGSVFDTITRRTFEEIYLKLPPLPTQKAIADTLSCLDAKIEVNNRIIKNLEQQAQAIFKSWFVDFEPFQDGEFVESELGLIPKGWSVGNLEGIAEITMGQSPKSSSYNNEGLGEVFYQGSSDFGWRFPARRRFTTDPKRMANKGDVLMSVRAPVGEINLAFEPCCIGRGLASIRNATCPSFLLYTLYAIQERLAQFNAEGTVFGSINQGALKTLQIITPPKNIMLRFDTIVKVNDQIIWTLSEQNTTLAALRDTLLPKLMSGEIEVPVEQD